MNNISSVFDPREFSRIMAEAQAPGVQFPQPLVNPPAQGPQVPQVAQAAQVPQAAQVAQAAQVPQAVQVSQAGQVLPAAQGVPVPQAAQAAGQNAAQNVAAGGQHEVEVNFDVPVHVLLLFCFFAILGTYYRLGLFILRKSLSLFFPWACYICLYMSLFSLFQRHVCKLSASVCISQRVSFLLQSPFLLFVGGNFVPHVFYSR